MGKWKLKWKLLKRAVLKRWLEFQYRNQDGSVCCCGDDMDLAHPGLSCPGYCRSLKDYVIDKELERRKC
jgi:hypothetical protein